MHPVNCEFITLAKRLADLPSRFKEKESDVGSPQFIGGKTGGDWWHIKILCGESVPQQKLTAAGS